MPAPVNEQLRPGLLQGISVVFAGPAAPADGGASPAAGRAMALCEQLDATVLACAMPESAGDAAADELQLQELLATLLAQSDPVPSVLVVDGPALFAQGGRERLAQCLQSAFELSRGLAQQSFIAAGAGRIVLLCPAAGTHAEAARAGLENLARTLSIEWARHGITALAIAPAEDTPAETQAMLLAYLASAAGAYFSGCLLDLRGTQALT